MPTLAESQGSPADAAGATSIPQAKPATAATPSPVVEAKTTPAAEPAKPEAGEDKRLIGRVATLSREAREAKEKVAAAEKRASEAQADAETLRTLRSSKDARKAIKELGLTFEEVVETFAVAEGEAKKVDPIAAIEQIRADLKAKEELAAEEKRQAQIAAGQAERDGALGDAERNIAAQIKAGGDRWELLSREPRPGKLATDEAMKVIAIAAEQGHTMTAAELGKVVVDVLDELENERVKLGERYRKTGKGKPETVASEDRAQRGTLADRQSETAKPPKTIDPEIAQGGILMRAQAKAQGDNSSEAVRRRVKDALKAAGVTLQR